MKFKKIYWIKNFETDETFTFSEDKISLEKLKEYNDKGFNIYQSVNTFIWDKRQDKDLAEIKSCFIDIDFPEITTLNLESKERALYLKNKYENFIIPKLKEIENKYGIQETEINLTYKWFHILFSYEESCYFIDINIHKEINDLLNNILWWDPNARDLSRVYKVPWFRDFKGGNKWKIKTLNKNINPLKITSELILKKFNIKEISFREFWKTLSKKINKEKITDVIQNNIKKINNLDALDLINQTILFFEKELKNKQKEIESITSKEFINNDIKKIKIKLNKLKYKEKNHIYCLLEEDWKTETSWLQISKNTNWNWEINDYSKKTRRGNYNFLKNWIFEKNEFELLMKFLNSFLNISLNINKDKKSQMSNKLLWDDHYNRIVIKQGLNQFETKQLEKIQKENKEVYAEYLEEYSRIDWFKKAYRGLFTYIYENKETLFKDYYEGKINKISFNLNDFLRDAFNLNTKDSIKDQKKVAKKLLLLMSSLTIPVQEMLENSVLKTTYKNILELSFLNNLKGWKGNKEKIEIEFKIPIEYVLGKPAFTNKKILSYKKWFKDTKAIDWILDVDDILNNTNNQYSENLESIYKKLGYTAKDAQKKKQLLKNTLTNFLKENFFKSFEFKENTLLISKYENLKYNLKSL